MFGNDAKVNFLIVAKDAATKVIGNVNKALGGLKSGTMAVGRAFAKMAAVGAAAVAAIAAGIGYAVKQAIDEEKGIVRLNQAIKANVKERVDLEKVEAKIAERQKELAFSDGELRDSLSVLLPLTKSTGKAFKAQAVAADLARLKEMSLEDASRQVGLALNGNTRVLKQLGIQLPKTATKADILAAIQAKVAGQAEAYAQTTEGQFTILNNSLADLVETIGTAFLPYANALVKWANEKLVPAIEAALPTIIEFAKAVIDTAIGIGQRLAPVIQAVAKFVVENVVPAFQAIADTLFGKGGVADSVIGVVGPIANRLLPVFGRLFAAVGDLLGTLGNLVGTLWGGGTGPLAGAVQGIGRLLEFLLDILTLIIRTIDGVIKSVMALGKAISNSPIGGLVNLVGGVAGKVLNPLGSLGSAVGGFLGPSPVKVPATSSPYGGRVVVPAPQVRVYANLDGRQIANSVNVRLGQTARSGNFLRGR